MKSFEEFIEDRRNLSSLSDHAKSELTKLSETKAGYNERISQLNDSSLVRIQCNLFNSAMIFDRNLTVRNMHIWENAINAINQLLLKGIGDIECYSALQQVSSISGHFNSALKDIQPPIAITCN